MLAYGIDIGGSSIKHGMVETTAGIVGVTDLGTPIPHTSRAFEALRATVIEIVGEALTRYTELTHVGISTAGGVDADGTILSSSKFDSYAGISWSDLLRETFPTLQRVVTYNDGKASAWGEFVTTDKQHSSHLHVVVGTGVGGGIIMNGVPLLGHHGYAGYIGHTKVIPNATRVCGCGSLGCVETASSSHGIRDRYNELSPQPVTHFREVIEAAEHGDDIAITALEEGGTWLGLAVANAMTLLNPSIITFGGGVIDATSTLSSHLGKDVYFEAVRAEIHRTAHHGVLNDIMLRKGSHGNDGGVIGAACLTIRT